jgi:hypothetical protein
VTLAFIGEVRRFLRVDVFDETLYEIVVPLDVLISGFVNWGDFGGPIFISPPIVCRLLLGLDGEGVGLEDPAEITGVLFSLLASISFPTKSCLP